MSLFDQLVIEASQALLNEPDLHDAFRQEMRRSGTAFQDVGTNCGPRLMAAAIFEPKTLKLKGL